MQYVQVEQRMKNYLDEKYNLYDDAQGKFYDTFFYDSSENDKKMLDMIVKKTADRDQKVEQIIKTNFNK